MELVEGLDQIRGAAPPAGQLRHQDGVEAGKGWQQKISRSSFMRLRHFFHDRLQGYLC